MKYVIFIFFLCSVVCAQPYSRSTITPNLRYEVWVGDSAGISIPDSIFRGLPCGVLFRDTIHGNWFVKPCGGNDSLAYAFPDSIILALKHGLYRSNANWVFIDSGCIRIEFKQRSQRHKGAYFEMKDTLIFKDTCASSGCTPIIIAGEFQRDICDTITIVGEGDVSIEWNSGIGDSLIIRVDTIKVPISMYLNFYHGASQTDSNSWFCTSYYTNLNAQMYPVANRFKIIGVSYTTQQVNSSTTVGGEYKFVSAATVITPSGSGGRSLGVRWVKKTSASDVLSFYAADIETGANPSIGTRTHILNLTIDDATHLPTDANYNTNLTVWLTKIK